MKPISELSDKEFEQHLKSIIPVLPIWAKDGATVQKEEQMDFTDRNGNTAKVVEVLWSDKKGKSHKSTKRVVWK